MIHALTGLALGVRPKVIALYFGPAFLRIKIVGIELRVNCIPLGGYTKFFGKRPGNGSGRPGGVGFGELSRPKKLLMHWTAPACLLLLGAGLLGPVQAATTLGQVFVTGIAAAIQKNPIATPAVRDFFAQFAAGQYMHVAGVIAVILVALNLPLELAPTLLLIGADRNRATAAAVRFFCSLLLLGTLICLLVWAVALLQVLIPPHIRR